MLPAVPPATPTSRGTGSADISFGELQKTCEENTIMRRLKNGWISEESWQLIAHRAMLRRIGRLCKTGGRCLNRQIGISLQTDWTDQTAVVGATVEAKLAGGNVQEAFHHLKGWYRAATEMQAKPCYHTMERQTLEQVDSMRGGNHLVIPSQLMSPQL
jgi:hypothetical protein